MHTAKKACDSLFTALSLDIGCLQALRLEHVHRPGHCYSGVVPCLQQHSSLIWSGEAEAEAICQCRYLRRQTCCYSNVKEKQAL